MTINRNNYEEYFLLYIDRELGQDEQLMVEDFVRRHPDLEKEFSALKQTIAVAPIMIYEGKEKLLKEEPERRMFPIYLMRIAATLIVLLTGGWFLLMMAGKTKKNSAPLAPSKQIALHQEAKANPSNGHKINPDAGGELKKTHAEGAALIKSTGRKSKNPGSTTDPGSKDPVQGSARNHVKNENNSGKTAPDQTENLSNEKESQSIPKSINDLPDIAQNNRMPGTPDVLPSTVNRQLSTILPSTIHHPPSTDSPPAENSTESSVFIFSNKSKAVGGFFKKLTAKSSDAAVTADNHRRRINISVFQFNVSK